MYDFQAVVNNILAYIPNILKALILLLVAFLAAFIVKKIVEKLLLKTNMDTHLAKGKEPSPSAIEDGKEKVSSIAKIVYFLVFLLFLPSILDALGMDSVSQPISNMMNNLLAFIPNIIGAGIILFIGYFIAKILRDLTQTLLQTINVDKFYKKIMPNAEKAPEVENKHVIADVLSKVVFVIVLIPIVTVALETLKIQSLTEPIVLILNKVLMMIPNIFVAIILIVFGYYIATFVGQLLESLLSSMGIENIYSWVDKKADTDIPRFNLSKMIGNVVKFLIILFITVEALGVLKLDVLNTIGYSIIAYIPLVLSGLLIIGIGVLGGYFVEGLIKKYANSPFSAMLAKYIIIIFAIFMTLEQIKFASTIVNTAFLLILGGLSVAFAVSFGLGGREFAKRQLKKIEEKVEREDDKPSIH